MQQERDREKEGVDELKAFRNPCVGDSILVLWHWPTVYLDTFNDFS